LADEAAGQVREEYERRLNVSRRPAGVGGRRGGDGARTSSFDGVGSTVAWPAPVHSSLPPENELWDVRAAARFLRMSVSWVYKRVEDGTLPVARLNGFALRFEPSALREWAATHVAGRLPLVRSRR